MNSHRKNAVIIGILFIVATASAIAALLLYDPILNDPDYILGGAAHASQVTLGALLELTLATAAIGTSIMLFPYLKKHNESLALGYVAFRLFEAVLVAIGVLSLLSLLTLSQAAAGGTVLDAGALRTVDASLRAIHGWTFILGPNFIFGIGTLLYSYLLWRTRLVPRAIAIVGQVGAVLIFVAALLELFGVIQQVSTWGAVLALPVAVYEMTLAVWLIVRGFSSTAVPAVPASTAAPELIAAR